MKYFCLAVFLLTGIAARSQQLSSYRHTYITHYSPALGDSVTIDLLVPLTYYQSSAQMHYPLMLLFDRQNEYTHRYNLQTIDMLTLNSQMPATVVAGIPFYAKSRSYLTSTRVNNGDSLSGMERTEKFLFTELIPRLQREYRADGLQLMMGHSRTAYLSGALLCKKYNQLDMAGAFSGFTTEKFEASDIARMDQALRNGKHRLCFYFSAGTTQEENDSRKDYRQLKHWLDSLRAGPQLNWHFAENSALNQSTNYSFSLTWALNDYFARYNRMLDEWLYVKLDSLPAKSVLTAFSRDLEALSSFYGKPVFPEPVHIYSLAGYYQEKGETELAVNLYIIGLKYYPGDYDMYLNIADISKNKGDGDAVRSWVDQAKHYLEKDQNIDENRKKEILQQLSAYLH